MATVVEGCITINCLLAFKVSLLTTDDLYGQIPPIEKDLYYGEPPPDYLPYTKSSIKAMSQPHMGSTIDIRFVVCQHIGT